MRVIGGKAKGRLLKAVPGDSTRPILDRVKVPLFDILRPRLEGARVLDMFAGTGAIGIEALSQGAEHCVFLDIHPKAIETIKANLVTTQLSREGEVRHTDAFTYVKNTSKSFNLIIVAPPQYKGVWIEAMHLLAERPAILARDGLIVVQIDPKEYEPLTLATLQETQQRKYGNTVLVFYRDSQEYAPVKPAEL
jgi:16S rRNA (guanine966-N2)-methyltransferase